MTRAKFGTILESELTEKVTKSPLWEGSILQQKAKLGMLNISDIKEKIESYGKCDDLTENEADLFHALIECDEHWERGWEFL